MKNNHEVNLNVQQTSQCLGDTTLSITTLSIKDLCDIQHKLVSITTLCYYAVSLCWVLHFLYYYHYIIIMLNVVFLSVVMINVVMLSVLAPVPSPQIID